jgi:hypothetical protein
MGGMASYTVPEVRDAYVKVVVDRVLGNCEKAREPKVNEFKDSLRGFLWWDPVGDPQALD